MSYVYKTRGGAEKRISIISERINLFKKMCGAIGQGTFWEDVTAVNEEIKEMKKEISALQLHITNLNNPKYLLEQLRSSEIF